MRRVLLVLHLCGCGGSSNPGADAAPMDAAAADAATPDAATPDAAQGCAGAEVGGHCWCLGNLNESCTTVCAAHGGYDDATRTVAGAAVAVDRDNAASCQAVLGALGASAFSPDVDNVNESDDYGCADEPGKARSELVSRNATWRGAPTSCWRAPVPA